MLVAGVIVMVFMPVAGLVVIMCGHASLSLLCMRRRKGMR
jgi:hypothetical protein